MFILMKSCPKETLPSQAQDRVVEVWLEQPGLCQKRAGKEPADPSGACVAIVSLRNHVADQMSGWVKLKSCEY